MSNQKSMRYDQNDYEALLASNIPASLVALPRCVLMTLRRRLSSSLVNWTM